MAILLKPDSLNLTKLLHMKISYNTSPAAKYPRAMPACMLTLTSISACALLSAQTELRLVVPLLVGMTAVMAIVLALTLYYGEQGTISISPAVILSVALLLRLLFLFSPPQLSDDLYRYLWDGWQLLHGTNPYTLAPGSVTPAPAIAPVHTLINHPQYVTIYPPAAQLLFAGGAALGGTVTGLKGLLVLIDLGLCALLIAVLKQLEMPAWRAVLYAWNPLAVIEIAASGHVDGAGLALLTTSLCLLVAEDKRPAGRSQRQWPFFLSGSLLAGAGLVKLFPFILVPVLVLLVPTERRAHFVSGFSAALAALLLPFLPSLLNIMSSLDIYARNWEFAGFAFNTLRSVTGSGNIARLLLAATFLLTVAVIVFRLAGCIAQEMSPITRGQQTLAACYAIAMALLLLTPTLQPWYALCLVVFLPFCAGPAGLILCWAVFLTYQVQIPYFTIGKWIENPYVTAAVFVAPVTAWFLARIYGQAKQLMVFRYTGVSRLLCGCGGVIR
jgi:hypothetical protein